jgi:hypothetical protein
VFFAHFMERDFVFPAAIFHERASPLEFAAWRRVEGAWYVAWEFFFLLPARFVS